MISCRKATKADLQDLYQLLVRMHSEVGIGRLSPQKTLARIIDLLSHGEIWVAEEDHKIIGTIGLGVQTYWYSDDAYFGDYWTYVEPEKRNSKAVFKLIDAVRKAARGRRLPLGLGVWSVQDVERKEKLFGRYLKKVGGLFMEGI